MIYKLEKLLVMPKWVGDPSVGYVDIRIYPSLWIEGKYNDLHRWYMNKRKELGMSVEDNFIIFLKRLLTNKKV